MSKLSLGKSRRGGPVTSTQCEDGGNNGQEVFLSREERIFQRQLEAAIEMSKEIKLKKRPLENEESDDDEDERKKAKINVDEKVEKDDDFKMTPSQEESQEVGQQKTRKMTLPLAESDDEDFLTDEKSDKNVEKGGNSKENVEKFKKNPQENVEKNEKNPRNSRVLVEKIDNMNLNKKEEEGKLSESNVKVGGKLSVRKQSENSRVMLEKIDLNKKEKEKVGGRQSESNMNVGGKLSGSTLNVGGRQSKSTMNVGGKLSESSLKIGGRQSEVGGKLSEGKRKVGGKQSESNKKGGETKRRSKVISSDDEEEEFEEESKAKVEASSRPRRNVRKLCVASSSESSDDEEEEFKPESKVKVQNSKKESKANVKAQHLTEESREETKVGSESSWPEKKPNGKSGESLETKVQVASSNRTKRVLIPKWTPPSRIGTPNSGGMSSSPNFSPAIRVGLSRNFRTPKPLHPHVKLTP